MAKTREKGWVCGSGQSPFSSMLKALGWRLTTEKWSWDWERGQSHQRAISLQGDKTVSSCVGSTTPKRRNTITVVPRQGETCPVRNTGVSFWSRCCGREGGKVRAGMRGDSKSRTILGLSIQWWLWALKSFN